MLNENHIQNIAHLNMISGEPFLDLRIEKSKAYAEKIVFGTPETDDELRDHVQYIVSKHFHLPFHSEMFDKMTLDDLFLELFLINVKQKPTEQAAEDYPL